eukprot:TRINITY_DN89937_c0_g1_i1.p1 TRINITY_DN89937_c0_g1~~TRINITY_DN89937_c0_g1_i1.p1  ORF type:complete len:692 (-),score=174.55 TRINITY_DN89937_c0_g1_i1:227-2302(-)
MAAAAVAEDAGASTDEVGLDGLEAELAMNFDAEMVQRERDAGAARTQKLQDLVDQQDAVLRGILQKMADEGEDGGGSPSHSAVHGHGSRFLSMGSTMGSLGDLSQASSTFEQYAATVASQITTRQEKLDNFQRRRRERAEKAERGFERKQVEAAAAEQRFADRQRGIADEHRRKAFAMQQRRNEQQKTFKESQREEDRICDEYYDERKQSPRGGGRGRHGSPKGKTHNLTGQTESTEESDIWKHTTQSHEIYVDTVDKWRQQVKENDQRNEAFRRRVLKAARMDDRAGKSLSLTRRKNSLSGSALAKATSLATSQGSLNSELGAETVSAAQGLEVTADISRSAPNLASPTSTATPHSATMTRWHERWLKTQEYAHEMDIKATQKQMQDEQVLSQGRTRIWNNNADIILRCQERGEVWRQRNDAATARRKKLAVTSDDELRAKMEAFANRRAALEKEAAEQLREHKEQRLHRMQDVKANYRNQVEDNEKNFRARWEEQNNSLAERYAHRLEGYVKKAESGGPYYEMAREAKARKQQYDLDFKDKSQREAEMKSSHHKNLTGDMRLPVKIAFSPKGVKALKKTHGKGRTPKSLDGPLLSDFDGGSDWLDETETEMLESAILEAQSLPRLQPSGSAQQAPSGAGGSREGRRPSMLDMNEDDGTENELLQDLERRSANWLQEMRRKNATNVNKMF